MSLLIENLVGQLDVYLDGAFITRFVGHGLPQQVRLNGAPGSTAYLALRCDPAGIAPHLRDILHAGFGPVRLQTVPLARINALSCSVLPTRKQLSILYQLSAEEAGPLRLSFRVTRADSNKRMSRDSAVTVDLGAGTIFVGLPHLLKCSTLAYWTPAASKPQRYQLHAELLRNKEVLDSMTITFGASFASLDAGQQFTVNGQPLLLRGMRLPGGVPAQGGDMLAGAAAREVMLLASAGFNAIMSDGAAPPIELLDEADARGLLYIIDVPPTTDEVNGGAPLYRPDIAGAASALGHHPSIIAWYWQSAGPVDRELALLRTFDLSRPAIIKTPQGVMLHLPAPREPVACAAIDARTGSAAPASTAFNWTLALRAAIEAEVPLLLTGTTAPRLRTDIPLSMADNERRDYALIAMVESLLISPRILGYFLRPSSEETLSGLTDRTGRHTRAFFTALALNQPQLLIPQPLFQNGELRMNAVLINHAALSGLYRFAILLTYPDGATRVYQQTTDDLSITKDERITSVDRLPRIALTMPGEYRVQLVMTGGRKVAARSRVLFFRLSPDGILSY